MQAKCQKKQPNESFGFSLYTLILKKGCLYVFGFITAKRRKINEVKTVSIERKI